MRDLARLIAMALWVGMAPASGGVCGGTQDPGAGSADVNRVLTGGLTGHAGTPAGLTGPIAFVSDRTGNWPNVEPCGGELHHPEGLSAAHRHDGHPGTAKPAAVDGRATGPRTTTGAGPGPVPGPEVGGRRPTLLPLAHKDEGGPEVPRFALPAREVVTCLGHPRPDALDPVAQVGR